LRRARGLPEPPAIVGALILTWPTSSAPGPRSRCRSGPRSSRWGRRPGAGRAGR